MRFVLGLALILSSLSVYSAPVRYFSAVLEDEKIKSLVSKEMELLSIDNTATYRCPGCFGFTLKFRTALETPQGVKLVEIEKFVQTRLDLATSEIKVVLDNTPSAR